MAKIKEYRNMKVYEQSGYQYKSTLAIMLKGQWLRELGFEEKRFRSFMKVRPKVKRVVGLTGTPSPNGMMDLLPIGTSMTW